MKTRKNILLRITDCISLKRKIKLLFLLFLVLPLLLLTFSSYRNTNQLILNQTLSSTGKSYDECVSILDRYFSGMAKTMDNLLTNADMYQFMKADSNQIFTQQIQYQRLNQLFGYMKKVSDVDRILLYVENDALHTENEQALLSLSHIEHSDWYRSLLSQGSSRFWLTPGVIMEADGSPSDFFSYVSILYSPDNFYEPVGLMQVDVAGEKIRQVLQDMPFAGDFFLGLTDDVESFYDRDGQKGNFRYEDIDSADTLPGSHQWDFLLFHGQKYILRSEKLYPPGWCLAAALPEHMVFQAQQQLYPRLLAEMVLIGLISYILACITVNSILNRLLLLNTEIKKMEKGNFNICLPNPGKDEIGEIINSFQSMSRRMKAMIDEQYEMGRAVKNAELCALQAQINPHFLYNSLNLINCIAIQKDVPQITEMVSALVKFYKLTLSGGREMVPLSQELMHVKTYVHIQNIRFQGKIHFSCEEPSWLGDCSVPKIILQPLVENAIVHGIQETAEQEGSVVVKFERETAMDGTEEVLIRIQDDGAGISPDVLKTILKKEQTHQGSSYGVKNINERLQLRFGKRYCLQYHSCTPGGTEVTVRIPAIRPEDESWGRG